MKTENTPTPFKYKNDDKRIMACHNHPGWAGFQEALDRGKKLVEGVKERRNQNA